MNFETFNDESGWGIADRTSLQGYIDASYEELVAVFGEPDRVCDEYKVDAEWTIRFENGVVATIYNYKDGKHYCGEEGLDVEDIRDWHIGGGYGQEAAILVQEELGHYREA